MKPKVKICGITTQKDALVCVHAGADALGFIFYKKSPRYIEPLHAAGIIQHLPPFVTTVAVFVNENRSNINQLIIKTGVKAIQLSGDESPDDCLNFPVKVIKTFRFRRPHETGILKNYKVDAALLDGAGEGEYGGSGRNPDFQTAVVTKRYHPLILAGGITPENIVEIVQKVQPYAIDINSGAELRPGRKDIQKINAIFENLSKMNYS